MLRLFPRLSAINAHAPCLPLACLVQRDKKRDDLVQATLESKNIR